MAAVRENDSSLANKCLALCQALNNQGKAFKFSLTIGNTFSFSLDSGERTVPIPKAGKKRTSPSTRKRNARRRKQFLEKKSTPSSEENQADLETNQQALAENHTFQCDQCDTVFKTRNGLKIHIGKSHKAPNSPEKLREASSELRPALYTSPILPSNREENCHNCGGPFSPSHQCESGEAVEIEEPTSLPQPQPPSTPPPPMCNGDGSEPVRCEMKDCDMVFMADSRKLAQRKKWHHEYDHFANPHYLKDPEYFESFKYEPKNLSKQS